MIFLNMWNFYVFRKKAETHGKHPLSSQMNQQMENFLLIESALCLAIDGLSKILINKQVNTHVSTSLVWLIDQ